MKHILLFFVLFHGCLTLNAQAEPGSEIFKELKSRDSLLFDMGFNNCRIDLYEDFVSEDLEFYHDQGGLTTNKEDFLEAVRTNICSNPDKKPVRKLVEGSLEVYPLYDNGKLYGAVQTGSHEFYIKEAGKELYKTSAADFTHVWLLQEKEWMLKRVLSYNHKSPQ